MLMFPVTTPPTFTQFHWYIGLDMRQVVTMTWPDLQASLMEVGLTTKTYWPYPDILQGFQDSKGPKNYPNWPDPELNYFFIDLGP